MIWEHFTKLEGKVPLREKCNYCPKDISAVSRNGTSGMWSHLDRCPKYLYRLDKGQKSITNYTNKEDGEASKMKPLNTEEIRNELAAMYIIDELPFNIVEGEGFKKYSRALEPRFKVPSRMTVVRDCFKFYALEKAKLKKLIKNHRLCLTTDTWTSIQNLSYMCLTAHWIDSEWTYQKRIINFEIVESHAGRIIGKKIEDCLIYWDIDRIFTITVDNASSNDTCLQYLVEHANWKSPILGNKYMHVRCSAHINNLIVKEGLIEQYKAITRIRNAIRYVKSSPARSAIFKRCIEREKISHRHLVCLDVDTRWNSIYKILEHAENFEKAFIRMGVKDPNYNSYFDNGEVKEVGHKEGYRDRDKDGEKSDNGRKRRSNKNIGPPKYEDFQISRCFARFLKIFYNVTLKFSGSLYVTSNGFFRELVSVHKAINALKSHTDSGMRNMAIKIEAKFDKYWSLGSKTNYVLFVAVMLDPRFKLEYIKFCFGEMYGPESVLTKSKTSYVEDTLKDLFAEYEDLYLFKKDQKSHETYDHVIPNMDIDDCDASLDYLDSQFAKSMEAKQDYDTMSELSAYLKAGVEKNEKDFNILNWWKINASKYQILALKAKDILAIPVSTIASEQAFSTGGVLSIHLEVL